MHPQSSSFHQTNLFGTDLLLQLDANDPLLKLSTVLPWHHFEEVFSVHYKEAVGAQTDTPNGWPAIAQAVGESK